MAPRTYVTKRVHFFDHQFLRVAEFADEQEYHIARQRDHNRGFHTAGVVEGLDVKFSDTPPGKFIDVANGWATDTDGREIVLGAGRERIDLTPGGADADVWISYNVTPDDPSADPGVTGIPTRDRDDPIIDVKPNGSAPPVGGVRLARVKGTGIETDVASRQEAELLNDSVLSQHIKPADNIKTPGGATSQALKSGAGIKTGHIADDAVTGDKVASSTITDDNLDTNAVTTTKIDTGAVTADKLDTDAVTTTKIDTGAVTADKLDTNAVTTTKIDTGAVTADKLDTNAVTTTKIDTGAVTADKLDTNAVTTTKILDANVTLAKLAPDAIGGAITAFCEFDGSGNGGWGEVGNHHNLNQAVKRWRWVIGPIGGPPIAIPMTGRYAFEWSVSASTTVAVFAYDPKNQTPLLVKLGGPPKATGVEVQVVDAANTPQDGVVTIIALATTGEP